MISQTIAENRAAGRRKYTRGKIMLKVESSDSAPMTIPAIAQPLGRYLYINEGTAMPATSNPNVATCAAPPAAKPNSWILLMVSNVLAAPGCDSTQLDTPEMARKIEAAIPPKNAICAPLAVTPRNCNLLVSDAVNMPSVMAAPS